MSSNIKMGAIVAIISVFPIAFFLALFWRFPIPFSGYESGILGAVHALAAVVFYGMLGGFILVGGLGAFGGWIAYKLNRTVPNTAKQLSIILGISAAIVSGLCLSLLDKFIGAW